MEQAVWNVRVFVQSCVCLGNKEVGGVELLWEGHDITREGIVHPNIQIYDRVSGRVVHPSRLRVLVKIERVHAEWLVVVRCSANDVCLERVLRKSSV